MFRLLDKVWFLKYRYYIITILIIWLWNNTSQYLAIRFEGDLTFISKPTILMLTRGTGFRPAESIPHFDVTCHVIHFPIGILHLHSIAACPAAPSGLGRLHSCLFSDQTNRCPNGKEPTCNCERCN